MLFHAFCARKMKSSIPLYFCLSFFFFSTSIPLSNCETSLFKSKSSSLGLLSSRCQVPKHDPSLRPSLLKFATNQWKIRFPTALSQRGLRTKMVESVRPQFVLFGSSIVAQSFDEGGWGAALANLYACKADVLLHGYNGWNSKQALQVLEEIFPKDSIIQPSLAIVYFGGNDAVIPSRPGHPPSSHVPLSEFKDNMAQIALHIKNLSETTRSIFLTVPPVNSDQVKEESPGCEKLRTMENLKKYSESIIQVCKELGIKYIDLFNAIQQREGWKTFFKDGIHLNSKGNEAVAEEIFKALKEADWVPSLYWESLPTEFDNFDS